LAQKKVQSAGKAKMLYDKLTNRYILYVLKPRCS